VSSLELLSREHDREHFDCGNDSLNTYFREAARQHIERGVSRTFVLVERHSIPPKPVLGYFTLNLCQLKAERLPAEFAKHFPREIAGIKLGRLAVAQNRQGQGLGRILLVAAMRKVLDVFESAGGIGLFVDAKDETAKEFYERFGFAPFPENPLLLFLPLQTIQEVLAKPKPA
jgi:GNAT superfamily N-acetyltransferase